MKSIAALKTVLAALAATAAATSSAPAASASSGTPIPGLFQINSELEFNAKVLEPATNHLTFVEFHYGPNQGNDKSSSGLEETAKEMGHVARFATVDCNKQDLKALCTQYSGSDHTIYVFGKQSEDQSQTEMLSKLDTNKNPIQKSQISDLVRARSTVLHFGSDEDDTEVARFLAAKFLNRVLLITAKGDSKHSALTTFEGLAIDFKSPETMFAVADAGSGVPDQILKKLNIDKHAAMPSAEQKASGAASILVLPSHGRRPHVYKKKVNARQRIQLSAFLNKFLDLTDPLDPFQAPQSAKQALPTQESASPLAITQSQMEMMVTTTTTSAPSNSKINLKRVYTKTELQDACFQSNSFPCLIASIGARNMLDGMLLLSQTVEDVAIKQRGYIQAIYLIDVTDDTKDLARWLELSPYGEMNRKERAAVREGEPIAWYHPTGVAYVNGAEGWQVNLKVGATVDRVREMVKSVQRGTNKESRVRVSKHLARFVSDEL